MEVAEKLTKEVLEEIEAIIQTRPQPEMNWKTFTPFPPRR